MKRRHSLKVIGATALGIGIHPTNLLSQGNSKSIKVAFIGDSITFAGGFIKYLQQYFSSKTKGVNYVFVNCGLNSETISNLTEKDHLKPRPYLFDRLDDILDAHKPDIAYFCYGINCGIYNPYDKANAEKFKEGLRRILEITAKKKIKAKLITPPPLSLSPQRKQQLIDNPPSSYSWKAPYPHYNEEVLDKYKEIVCEFKSKKIDVIDINTPLKNNINKSYGDDPIHPNDFGHYVIAKAILSSMGYNSSELAY